ncbi:hypothetical protein GA0116948_10965 [Chitinophaga costaii]|uniref:Glycosyl-4,4'-diaponeurosporenoate acyltransferase n=1 Tax=Chitinophaga costaii TaxID=1335309 RepID=A0A1C4ENJ6_9BACT|nr:hypothetical protein [Chitinophaga costaii]PUZ22469.1 hypothetical protein DCM91_14465 [Chitinophaga costaii]SCC45168.1 hypothetical protein GA0116948_10965 [Chitinophaga costaii]
MPPKEQFILQPQWLAALYNTLPYLIWSAMHLVPAFYYYDHFMLPSWLWVILPLWGLPYTLRPAVMDFVSLSKRPEWYHRLGVDVIQDYVQHGGMVNRLIRRRYPAYRIVYDKATVRKQLSASYMFERFHLGMLLLFGALSVHAVSGRCWKWALLLLLSNGMYNVYPILLQQFIRLRLKRLLQ